MIKSLQDAKKMQKKAKKEQRYNLHKTMLGRTKNTKNHLQL